MADSPTPRPPASANGSFAKTPFLHLLVYSLEKRLTGSIQLFSPDSRSAAILFVEGHPAKVRTSEPVAYLGRVLCDVGYLTEDQLGHSLVELAKAKARQPTLHGELLVEMGLIDVTKRSVGLREQVARKLRHIAALPAETEYAYYDGFDALRGWGGEGNAVDPMSLLWGMLVECAPWDHVTPALGRLSSSTLRLAHGKGFERLGLKNKELAAARLLSVRPMNVPSLATAAHLDDRTAQLLSYLLLVTKQVDLLPSAEVSPVLAEPGSPSNPRERVRPQATPSPPSMAPKMSRSGKHASLSPVPPTTLAPEHAARWREIVERAASIDRADYFMMLDIARDATHEDVEAAFFALVKRWHPDRLPPELTPLREACSRVFSRMSEAHATLADDEKRTRYMRLIADGSGSPEMQATVAKVVEAATNFQKAEVCFRRNDLTQAEALCRKALEDDPTQPDYHAMIAWLTALKPENHSPEKTNESIRVLESAIAMNDKCERAHFWRGMLFKRLGKTEMAVNDFQRVVELNPRNIDAAREVRLHNMRGKGRRSSKPPPARHSTPASPRPGESAKPGLLGRFFKKT